MGGATRLVARIGRPVIPLDGQIHGAQFDGGQGILVACVRSLLVARVAGAVERLGHNAAGFRPVDAELGALRGTGHVGFDADACELGWIGNE